MKYWISVGVLLLVSASIACASSVPPAGPAAPSATTQGPAQPSLGRGPEQQWTAMVAAAKNEGSLLVYTSQGNDLRTEVGGAFSSKYGIKVEWVTAATAQLSNKLATERRAGLYLGDAIMGGASSLIGEFKPHGILDPIEPVVVLPEAKDPKAWKTGAPYADKDATTVTLLAIPTRHLARNTDMVKEDEVKSYRDLLDPRWKGKITIYDPTIGGTTQSWSAGLAQNWGPEAAKEYLRKLASQDLAVSREKRTQVEWVARGKYPLGLGLAQSEVADMSYKLGVPVEYMNVAEGVVLTPGGGALGLVNRAAHPNAARVFVNWLMTKEGGIVVQKGHGNPSARMDVPTTGLAPSLIVPPGTPSVSQMTEDYNRMLKDWAPVIKEIFGPLIK